MSIEDVVLVATVREDICNNRAQAEIPRQIEATQAMLAHVAGNDILPAGFKSGASEKKLNSTEPVAAGQAAEGDSENGSKTAAATSPAEDDKREGDGHLVSSSGVWVVNGTQVTDKAHCRKQGLPPVRYLRARTTSRTSSNRHRRPRLRIIQMTARKNTPRK
jgi:hypothetical protein